MLPRQHSQDLGKHKILVLVPVYEREGLQDIFKGSDRVDWLDLAPKTKEYYL